MPQGRVRDFGITIGRLPSGPHNAITDVPGVLVGHVTVCQGDAVRTGVTALLPHERNLFAEPVPAATHVINGFGKSLGLPQIAELGVIETPICLTSTLNIWRVADAMVDYLAARNPGAYSFNIVCGECNDGYLNDAVGRHVTAAHVHAALENAAAGPVAEGCVGAGMGMRGFGYKAGIGTSSRLIRLEGAEHTVGVLVLTNTGEPLELRIDGLPVGRWLHQAPPQSQELGSIMIIVATDAKLDPRQLQRLAKRATFGLARAGGTAGHGSGDFVIAFAVPPREAPPIPEARITHLFLPVIEAVEEAIINSLFTAETVTGRDGHKAEALPVERVVELLRQHSHSAGGH